MVGMEGMPLLSDDSINRKTTSADRNGCTRCEFQSPLFESQEFMDGMRL